jgi:hypothetical protein
MLEIENPYKVGRSGEIFILVGKADLQRLKDIDTMAQTWQPGRGYAPPKRLHAILKFLYNVESITPPQPWTEPGV